MKMLAGLVHEGLAEAKVGELVKACGADRQITGKPRRERGTFRARNQGDAGGYVSGPSSSKANKIRNYCVATRRSKPRR